MSFVSVNRWENGQTRPTALAWRRIVELESGSAESGGNPPRALAERPASYSIDAGANPPNRRDAPAPPPSAGTVRATFYLDPSLHQALRRQAATTRRSMSEIVNEALRAALREDAHDLAAFAERDVETSMSYESFRTRSAADSRR